MEMPTDTLEDFSSFHNLVVWITLILSVNKSQQDIDDDPIDSKSHTHPSHSETSRLLTSSLSLGVPVPRGTQCIETLCINLNIDGPPVGSTSDTHPSLSNVLVVPE